MLAVLFQRNSALGKVFRLGAMWEILFTIPLYLIFASILSTVALITILNIPDNFDPY
jgi:hypothetical protein